MSTTIPSRYITLQCNDEVLDFPRAKLDKLKGVMAETNGCLDMYYIKAPFEVTINQLKWVCSMICGAAPDRKQEILGFKNKYYFVKLAKLLGASDEEIVKYLGSHDFKVNTGTEYCYLLYKEIEELMDWRQAFRNGMFTDIVTSTLMSSEYRNDPILLVEALKFYCSYKFELVFDNNDVANQKALDQLVKQRCDCLSKNLLNPHDPIFANYFKYVPSVGDVWYQKDIDINTKPEVGENILVNVEDAKTKFEQFTFGLLTKSPNARRVNPFPWDNVVVAGGSVCRFLDSKINPKSAKQSDLDIFIIGKNHESRTEAFANVLDWFDSPNTFYAIRNSVLSVYLMDIQRKFQIISGTYTSAYDVISRFDMSHIRWAYQNGRFLGLPESFMSLKSKTTELLNTRRIKTNRMIKAIRLGYSIKKTKEVTEIIDISDLLVTPNMQLDKIIRELGVFYYPRREEDMEPADLTNYILSMIERDSGAILVTDNVRYARDNVTISGNFESDYDMLLFTNFKSDIIDKIPQNRALARCVMKSKYGPIKLSTGNMKVASFVNSEEGITIELTTTDAFNEFVRNLETNVYRMYRGNWVVTKKLIDNNRVQFKIPKFKLNAKTARGAAYLRNQRGVPMVIEEDVKVGDELQVLFSIEVLMDRNLRGFELTPIKLIKYTTVEAAELKNELDRDRAMEEEIQKSLHDAEDIKAEYEEIVL